MCVPFSQLQVCGAVCCVGIFNYQSDGIMVFDVKHSYVLVLLNS